MFFSLSDLLLNLISKKSRRLPWDFNAHTYSRLYPDIKTTGFKPRSHYRNIGRFEPRPYKNIHPSLWRKFNKNKKTILMVIDAKSSFSYHIEHSIPLLAEHFNIFLVIASGYEYCAFYAPFCFHIVSDCSFFHSLQRTFLWTKYIKKRVNPIFTLIDTSRCSHLVRSLHIQGVATLFLLGTPFEPLSNNLIRTIKYATRILCNNKASADYITHEYMYGVPANVEILPHFSGTWPEKRPEKTNNNQPQPALGAAIPHLPQDRKEDCFILGQGAVIYENAIDIFIKIARECHLLRPNFPFQFIWIDDGTQGDDHYRKMLEWMIDEAELYGLVRIAPARLAQTLSPDRALVFLDMARFVSRTAAAHAMLRASKAVIALEGVAPLCDIFHQTGLSSNYLFAPEEVKDMAKAILREAQGQTSHLAEKRREAAKKIGDTHHYCNRLIDIGFKAAQDRAQETADIDYLSKQKTFKNSYFHTKNGKVSKYASSRYIRNWRSGLYPLRPFAGFHPGIYAKHHNLKKTFEDPLVHYLKSGQPQGVWNWQIINQMVPHLKKTQNYKIALHIHAYYPQMLKDMMRRLMVNKIRPDLFISVCDESARQEVEAHIQHYPALTDMRVVPNRGRDIGPLLTEFGIDLVKNYDIIGHIHSKKSPHITDRDYLSRWILSLMVNLLGNGEKLASADIIIENMITSWPENYQKQTTNQQQPPIGFVFPDDKNAVSWGKNYTIASRLALKLGIEKLPDFINFSVGTMFWISKDVLQPFVDLNLTWEDYPPEPLAIDGTILHAIERLFAVVCEYKGYRNACTYFNQ